jgi:hypothetical protein
MSKQKSRVYILEDRNLHRGISVMKIIIIRCASAANVVCKDVDVFGARNLLLSHFV